MKRTMSLLLALCMVFAMTACSQANDDVSENHSEPESTIVLEETPEPPATTEPPVEEPTVPTEEPQEEGSNILIAYFTWAENTHVEDPDSVDVDATTSASVLMPGNVGLLAQWIEEETGGDTFSIITQEPYSSDYDTCLNRAIDEHDNGERPAITGHVENMADYDIVFLGFPNWWYSCPMAILTFIEEHDLSGKTIIPFCSHGTGGFAASLQDIGASLPEDCTVLEEFGAYRPEVAQSQDELLTWLSGLDIEY